MLLRLLRTYLAPYRRWLSVIVVLQFISTVAMLFLPSINADIIDNGVATGDTDYIWRLGAVMLAVSLVQILCSVVAVWFAARTGMAFGRDLRSAVFRKVSSFSGREVATFGAPSLITRNTNDVQQVQMLALMTCTMAVTVPIMMVGGVVMAMREDLGLSWLLIVVVPTLFLCVGLVVSQMVPSFRLVQERIDEVNRVLREQITGIRVVRAFVREPLETKRFAKANDELTEVSVRAGRWMATMFPLVMMVVNVSSVAVIWFGGQRVDDGTMQVGALTAFLSYLMQILMSVMMGTFMLMMIPRSSVCADRIAEVLDTDSSVVPPAISDRTRAGAGRARAHGGRLHLPRSRAARAERHQLLGPGRPDRGRDRVHRRRQEHADQPDAAPARRHGGRGPGRRGRRTQPRPGGVVVADRAGAAAGLPVHRHRRHQPAPRQARRHRRRALAGPGDRAGP